mmetsp:Transcript_1372/g.4308  ORF Transcript_1372/g.4308 Transcript_1372/m.4308 type:complete len:239 (+) Transcript_1372:251-967(+)
MCELPRWNSLRASVRTRDWLKTGSCLFVTLSTSLTVILASGEMSSSDLSSTTPTHVPSTREGPEYAGTREWPAAPSFRIMRASSTSSSRTANTWSMGVSTCSTVTREKTKARCTMVDSSTLSSPPPSPSPSVWCITSACSWSREYRCATSSPTNQSSDFDNGIATGNQRTMRTRTSGAAVDPMAKPYFEQMDCGRISPKMTESAVDTTSATTPDARSARISGSAVYSTTFVRISVHKR